MPQSPPPGDELVVQARLAGFSLLGIKSGVRACVGAIQAGALPNPAAMVPVPSGPRKTQVYVSYQPGAKWAESRVLTTYLIWWAEGNTLIHKFWQTEGEYESETPEELSTINGILDSSIAKDTRLSAFVSNKEGKACTPSFCSSSSSSFYFFPLKGKDGHFFFFFWGYSSFS